MTLEFYFQVLFCKFVRIRKNTFSIPLLQMLRFSRRVKYNDTVYRRICYGFQTKTKEMYEVRFFERSSVLDETGIFINVSAGLMGPDADMFHQTLLLKRHQALPNRLNQI